MILRANKKCYMFVDFFLNGNEEVNIVNWDPDHR